MQKGNRQIRARDNSEMEALTAKGYKKVSVEIKVPEDGVDNSDKDKADNSDKKANSKKTKKEVDANVETDNNNNEKG